MTRPEIAPVAIGGHLVGDGHPPLFVAEIGTFFNKDVDLAEAYLRAIAEAGAPVFKTEILHDPDVCLKDAALLHEYQHATGRTTEVYRELVERKCNPLSAYRRLFDRCTALGIPFVATVYDITGIDFLADAGAAGIKIARDNVNNVPLIRHAAGTGLPLILDAGVVYLDEIGFAVRLAQASGAGGVIVNHHPGRNPAPPEAHNLCMIESYKQSLGVPVGLACHYRGDEILYAAAALGVNLIEKGVVDDPDRAEQDLVSAASLGDVREIIRKVHNCWQSVGRSPLRHREPRELSVRKGLVATAAIRAGEVFDGSNTGFAWPPVGVSVEHWDIVLGNQAARDLGPQDPIHWSDIRFGPPTPPDRFQGRKV
ncbi:MAG: N-acetylneuraminate synthase family protein [Vicinamibacterales bacterium]